MSEKPGSIVDLKISNKPSKRCYFGLCNNNNIVYIYGGWNGSYLDDFYYLVCMF